MKPRAPKFCTDARRARPTSGTSLRVASISDWRFPRAHSLLAVLSFACSSPSEEPATGGSGGGFLVGGTAGQPIAGSTGTQGGAGWSSAGATSGGVSGSPGGGGRANTAGASAGGLPSAGAGGKAAASAGKGGASGTAGSTSSAGAAGKAGSAKAFNECRFHFGTVDSQARNNSALVQQLDYFVPGWMGLKDTFDQQYVCTDANGAFRDLVPVVVSYVIAFSARNHAGLQDCNVDDNTNLCRYGASYLRDNLTSRILPTYESYARGYANCFGTTRPIIFIMEPDYYQYHVGGDARSLSPQEAGQIMGQLVGAIREHLPNAIFSLDVSPWMPNNGANWFPSFNLADFTFINTSGGGTDANNSRIRARDSMTWAGVRQVTGKPILADTGYGAAGSSEGHDALWDSVSNINARIADGVVGLAQYNPSNNWARTIGQIRSQLSAPSVCP